MGQERPLILVIDDDLDTRVVLAQYMDYCGYSVIAANDGASGLIKAGEEQPDLILLDIIMPGLDGYETCRRLKSQKNTCNIPVIYMTGITTHNAIWQAFEAGGNDYLPKPLTYLEVSTRIKMHLRNRALIRETENRFQTIFQKSPLGFVISRVSDNVMVDVNNAFLDIYNRKSKEEIVGFTSKQLNLWCDQRDRDRVLSLLARNGELRNFEMKVPRGDGKSGYILLAAGKVVLNGEECILWIINDITERKELEKQRQASAQRLIKLEEDLRRKVAAEIHDEVGRDLTALGFNCKIISNLVPEEVRNKQENQNRINDTKELLENVHHSLRGIMAKLWPPVLDDYGLVSALQWHAEIFAQRTNIEVYVQADDFPRLDREVDLALFRIAHEGLTNIFKHAETRKAYVILKANQRHLKLVILDHGKGFHSEDKITPPRTGQGGWGLGIMRERAEMMGGCLTLDTAPGKGVKITVDIAREMS